MTTLSTVNTPRNSEDVLDGLAAVLVVYDRKVDPTPALLAVLGLVRTVVLVDNAPDGHPGASAWSRDGRVTVVTNANRGGLAGAYNAARAWLQEHAPQTRHLVFIDDDSDATVLAAFLRDPQVRSMLERADTAAVAPAHRDRATGMRAKHLLLTRWRWHQLPRELSGLNRVSFVINSMSVWRMEALQRIGAHNEWLGVDHVDTEYCLRAGDQGLGIYLHGDHEFAQSIGERRAYRFLGFTLQSGGHSAQRRHSIGRANAWLACAYLSSKPAFAVLRTALVLYEALGILMAEDKRLAKFCALALGTFSGIARGIRG